MMQLSVWLSVVMVGTLLAIGAYTVYPFVEERFLGRFDAYLAELLDLCDKMFMTPTKRSIATAILATTALLGILGFYATFGFGFINAIFTVFLSVLGWWLPKIALFAMWERRLAKFDDQLIDSLNLLSNSLKSGMNLSQSIQVLVREMPNPISQEFAMVLSQEKVGLTLDDALQKMTERIPSEDLSVVIQSILILRETGGNLSETFDVIANTIRERRRIDGKIKSMTAQGKTMGLILFLFPFAMLAFFYSVNPDYVSVLFNTQLGWVLITVMLTSQILGGLWMRKIVRIEV